MLPIIRFRKIGIRICSFSLLCVLFITGLVSFVPTLAQADTWTVSNETPISGVLTNDYCPFAEPVAYSGTLHAESHVTLDGDGGYHSHLHFNDQNVSGTGLTSGSTYRLVTDLLSFSFNIRFPFPHEIAQVNRFNLVGQGPDNNMQGKFTVHVTINANGEVTVNFANFSFECNK